MSVWVNAFAGKWVDTCVNPSDAACAYRWVHNGVCVCDDKRV